MKPEFYYKMIMYKYTIYRQYENYEVFDDDKKMIMYARNISRFFGPEQVVFFNANHEEFARYKCSLFLSFGFNHRIIFNDNNVCFIRGKWNGLFLKYMGNRYSIKYKHNRDELFENDKYIGYISSKQTGASESEHLVNCLQKEACLIFSMVDIAINNFNVN